MQRWDEHDVVCFPEYRGSPTRAHHAEIIGLASLWMVLSLPPNFLARLATGRLDCGIAALPGAVAGLASEGGRTSPRADAPVPGQAPYSPVSSCDATCRPADDEFCNSIRSRSTAWFMKFQRETGLNECFSRSSPAYGRRREWAFFDIKLAWDAYYRRR
ncbi:hypothetical protein EHS39_34300 [Ensifer sp. MPMI2T]|nr:hypothetical protein EHS39_34300 [Ensifer sp. MPMI2T]